MEYSFDILDEIYKVSISCLEKPYKYGARRWDGDSDNFPQDFDCSSFVHAVYKYVGIDIPMRTIEQAAVGKKVDGALEIGDLLFFKGDTGYYNPQFPDGIGHVLMYLGGTPKEIVIGACGNFPYKKKRVGKVTLLTLKKVMSRNDFRLARRIVGYV